MAALEAGKIREMEPTTQRALELHMCGKWAERLLAHFAPFAEHIAYMQDILGEDFRKEALDLLEDSRFRTLRQHMPGLRESPQERLHRHPMAGTTCAGLIPRPSTPERALRWLKDAILRRGVTPGLVKPLSWHSFRVFIPDCAFQMGIPRERRMYLGNWLTESTADVYVWEKRNVVVEIWGQVAQKVPNLNLGPGRERREDLNHPDWADPLPPPAVDITDAGPEGREDQIEKEGEASPSVPSRKRTIGSIMVSGGTRTWGHTSEGQGPVSSHPGPPPSGGCGGQTHGQRRPVQNPPAECGGHGRGMWLATSGL